MNVFRLKFSVWIWISNQKVVGFSGETMVIAWNLIKKIILLTIIKAQLSFIKLLIDKTALFSFGFTVRDATNATHDDLSENSINIIGYNKRDSRKKVLINYINH